MTGDRSHGRFVLIHADESCLGNQKAGPRPGGAAAMVEARGEDGAVDRRDWYYAARTTTNNRMALGGAIGVLERLLKSPQPLEIHFVSDSRYLVDGMNEWVPNWKTRGWTRKGGDIENLELWQRLDHIARPAKVQFHWVRGHDGHPKNEYVDHLAVRAAKTQESSEGLVRSELTEWLHEQSEQLNGHDPDRHFADLEARLTR